MNGRRHASRYLSNDRRECVLISEIPPGRVTALKGCLQIFEINGMADKLEAHLFVAAIQKHHRTLEVLTVESVGDYYEECFFPRDQERIFLLRHERDVRASSRDRGEHLCRQRFHCRIVEDRGLAQVNPYDRSLGLRFPWRMEC